VCGGTDKFFANNVAHSVHYGAYIYGKKMQTCTALSSFVAYKAWMMGVWSIIDNQDLIFNNVTVFDSRIGLSAIVLGPSPTQHVIGNWKVVVNNSLFVAETANFRCRETKPIYQMMSVYPTSYSRVGIIMPTFSSAQNWFRRFEPQPGYGSINGSTWVNNTVFASFGTDACGRRNYMVTNNGLSPDANHPIYIQNASIVNSNTNSSVYLFSPNPAWINPTDCVDMDCDGPRVIKSNCLDLE
jgi:hypothetical protein